MQRSTVSMPVQVWSEPNMRAHKFMRSIAEVPHDHIPYMWSFTSVEGEGTHIGRPRVFARLAGCAVGCAWCDSRYTWNIKGKDSRILPIDDVYADIISVAGSLDEVSITGGEPMHYPQQLLSLASRLKDAGYYLNMETSGLFISHGIFSIFDTVGLDIKGPSSKVLLSRENIQRIIDAWKMHPGVQLKMVVQTIEDLIWLERNFKECMRGEDRRNHHPIVLTPCIPEDVGDRTAMQNVLDMVVQ